jgi:AcrR family transcriptional regulator
LAIPRPILPGAGALTDRRAQIIDIAKGMLAERGISQTTVRQIGSGAGILSGSLYHYFKSKDDIVDAILSEFCTTVLGGYWKIASRPDTDSAEQVRLMVRYGFSLIIEHTAALVIAHREAADLVRNPRFAYLVDFDLEVERHYTDVFARGIESGQFSPDSDPRMLYRFLRDSIVGAIRWYVPTKGATTDQIADSIVDVVLYGILA